MVCLHYSYRLEETKKLTPKQVYLMAKGIEKKVKDQIQILSSILGSKVKFQEEKETIDIKEENTDFIDSIDSEKFDSLMAGSKKI